MGAAENLELYRRFVNDQYVPYVPRKEEVTRFVAPKEPGLSLDFETRAHLYVANRYPLMLSGPTGTGKTTLVSNIASLLGVPMCKQEGHDDFTLDEACRQLRTDSQRRTIMEPGPLLRALLWGGIYFLEEIASMEENRIVGLHSVLQNMRLDVLTHYGNINVDLNEVKDFRVIGAGNFAYSPHTFNPATRARFVWMDVPRLRGDQFEETLLDHLNGTHSLEGKSLDAIQERIANTYSEPPTHRQKESLAHLMKKLQDDLDSCAKKAKVRFDQNHAGHKRAASCYSPRLLQADFLQIVKEMIIHPAAGPLWYKGRNEDLMESFYGIAKKHIDSHSNLFSRNTLP